MSEGNTCPECGAELPASAPRGLCPGCLLKRGLETNTIGYTEQPAPAARWAPPEVEELAQRFPELEIIRLIGRGGMGAVYQARQKNLDRVVALKILPPEMGHDAAFAQRFAREAQAMAKLNHPHIVSIYEFGERSGWYYFLMEYVDGVSLRGLLDSGHVSPKEALAIVPQICEALQYAHEQGIVHRDIKPENILLNKQGQVKIADFGLAKLMGRTASPAATAEKVMGTPQYMAPEQLERPAEVDHRADIYSLGVVFYQMLTGELPSQAIEPPSHKVLIDVRLDEVVLRALEKEPQRRYQQASEVKTQVETIATTPGPMASAASHEGPDRDALERARQDVRLPAIGLRVAAGINLGLILLIVGGVWIHNRIIAGRPAEPGGISPPVIAVNMLPMLLGFVVNVVLLRSAKAMSDLRSYAWAVVGSFLAMIAFPGNLIGLPMGIWALVVLNRRAVKGAFAANYITGQSAGGQASDAFSPSGREAGTSSSATAGTFAPTRWKLLGWAFVLAVGGIAMGVNITPFQPYGLTTLTWGVFFAMAATVATLISRKRPGQFKAATQIVLTGGMGILVAVIWCVFHTPHLAMAWSVAITAACIYGSGYCLFRMASMWRNGWGHSANALASPASQPAHRIPPLLNVLIALTALSSTGVLLLNTWHDHHTQDLKAIKECPAFFKPVTQPSPIRLGMVRTGDLNVWRDFLGSIAAVAESTPASLPHASRAPITVTFSISEDIAPKVAQDTYGSRHLAVEIFDRSREKKLAEGLLVSTDRQLDPSTTMLGCRAVATPIHDELLLPNQPVNGRLLLETKHGVTLVPSAALISQPQSMVVYVITPDHTVAVRPVSFGNTDGQCTEITAGLSPGETVVIEGADQLHDGQKWVPKPPIETQESPPVSAAQTEEWLLTVGEIRAGFGWRPEPNSKDPVDRAYLKQHPTSLQAPATQAATQPVRLRYFVQIVVGLDRMTYQGQRTTWAQLPELLKEVPDRPNTVLCLAFDPQKMSKMLAKEADELQFRAAELVRQFGFAYLSYVGEHPLGEKGRPPVTVPASQPSATPNSR